MSSRQAGRLAVVVKGWPRLSETFIAQELVALEREGIDLEIWSLRHPTDVKRHPLHEQLEAPVHYLPEYLRDAPVRVLLGLAGSLRRPGFLTATRHLFRDYRRDRTPNRLRRFGQACVLAREVGADVVGFYAHFLHTPASVARYAAILTGRPWSFSAHAKDIWTTPDWEVSEKLSVDNYGAVFGATCTAYGAERLRSLAEEPERIELVYHGLDLSRFPTPPDRALRAVDTTLHLMSVGRLVEKKGFDRLIQALAMLPKDLDWHWTHIGGGELGARMRALAEAQGVAQHVTWRGACDQPEVIEAMRDAHLFVLPSRIAANGDRDGLPNVLMEAASQKLPILSTPVSAIPEFIENGVHGLLVKDDPQSLADAIANFARCPEQAPVLADAAYERLTCEFTMSPGIRRLKEKLSAMMEAGR